MVYFLLILSFSILENQAQSVYRSSSSNCEWCGANDAPALSKLKAFAKIHADTAKGERITIQGTVYHPDGRTPAPGILVYVYHTNSSGVYPKTGNEKDNSKRHGYLRGWMITDEAGQYSFKTIMPGIYPSRSEPAHIHYTITGKNFYEYWIHSLLFEGDDLIQESERNLGPRSGGSRRITELINDGRELVGYRDIILNSELMEKF